MRPEPLLDAGRPDSVSVGDDMSPWTGSSPIWTSLRRQGMKAVTSQQSHTVGRIDKFPSQGRPSPRMRTCRVLPVAASLPGRWFRHPAPCAGGTVSRYPFIGQVDWKS